MKKAAITVASAAAMLLAAAAIGAIGAIPSAPAAAADLGDRAISPPEDFEPRRGWGGDDFDRWSGFYAGASLGYGFGDVDVTGSAGLFSFEHEGVNWSVFAGHNWQQGNRVFGFEADIGSGNMSGAAVSGANAFTTDVNALGSLRARYGFIAAPGVLLYGTAGLAWSSMDFELNGGQDRSETLFGIAVGAGAEFVVAPNWKLRLEYIYTDFAPEKVEQSGLINRYDPDFHTIRAGIGTKF